MNNITGKRVMVCEEVGSRESGGLSSLLHCGLAF